jgi:MFS transporter, ACS family, tartrate transporter
MTTNQDTALLELNTTKKIRNRLIPFLILLYFFAMLDRVNVGYAALTMNKELAISSQQYGLVAGIFFIGQFLFEIPSNVALHKFGARIWIARILITWGIASTATGFIHTANHLYITRFLLGVMEAGFYPGMVLYMTFWFRAKDRAKVISLFMLAVPLSSVFGAPISGLILDGVKLAGISSWRWLFILEGFPAVILGIITLFYLPNRPKDAKWLSDKEKLWIEGEITREQQAVASKHKYSFMQALVGSTVWLLALIYFSKTMAVYGVGFFAPQLIKGLTKGLSNFEIGLVNAIPYIVSCFVMVWWGKHSDRTGERRWHVAIPLFVCALGLLGLGYTKNPILAVVFLSIAYSGSYSVYGAFWSIASMAYTGSAAAVAMAAINSIANLGGFVGPYGTATHSNYAGFYAIAAILFIAVGVTLSLPFAKQDVHKQTDTSNSV